MKVITIEPVDGRLVRDPVTGREILGQTRVDGDDPFWIRRIADGDVRECAVQVQEEPAQEESAQEVNAAEQGGQ